MNNKMSFQEFITCIKEKVQEKSGKEVSIQEIEKNNGIKTYAIILYSKGETLLPLLYLEEFYQKYIETEPEVELDAVAAEIIRHYNMYLPKENPEVEDIIGFEGIQNKLRLKLVNYKNNSNLLKNVPHYKYLDLAVVLVILTENTYSENVHREIATILVKENYMGYWKKGKEELFQKAFQNGKDKIEIDSMTSILKELCPMEEVVEEMDELMAFPMYVMTNKERLYGASAMLYIDELQRFSDEKEIRKIWIIPSSIHESILILDRKENFSAEEIKGMIREVNETQLLPEEILSDNVYTYERNSNEIKVM